MPALHTLWVLVDERSSSERMALLVHSVVWDPADGWSDTRRMALPVLRALWVRVDERSGSGWMAPPPN